MSQSTRSSATVLALCGTIGVITVAATLAWGRGSLVPKSARPARKSVRMATEEYGKRLIAQTTELLGPDVADPKMRYTDSRLACASCHIGAGVEPGNLSLVAAMSRYPRISPRSGGNETIQDRINGCMTRSMNGRALAEDSPEMIAMVSYLRFLGDQDAATGASQRKAHESPAFKTPNRAANLEAGQRVFEQRCAACHQSDGFGLPASGNPGTMVTYSRRCGDPTASTTERACTAQLAKDRHHGTPVRKRGLKQVEPHESGKQIPIGADPVAEREGQQHKRAGNHTQIAIYGHTSFLLRLLNR